MKTLIMITGLAIFSHTATADMTDIDSAANTMNIQQLKQFASQEHDYNQAYANYRLAISANILGQKTLAISALNKAQATLEALNASQASGENYTLLASVYGMKIGLDNTQAQSLGIKYGQALTQAQQLTPQSPRLKLVQAIAAFNTPATYGGSMQKTLKLADEAVSLFQAPCEQICWGHAEAYIWRGLAKQELGDPQGAISDWQQALNVQEDYGWAKFLLKQNASLSSQH